MGTETLWDILGAGGKRVIVLNVPLTYPPRRVNGLMVTGLLTPVSARDMSYPFALE
jgi:predicted AlkP superfamily phosphohydrolase/phosphomutase